MGCSLLPDALRPFKIYCASPSITSQLALLLWQAVEIGPLGHVRVVEALQNFVQKCDPVTSGIHFTLRKSSVSVKIYQFKFYLFVPFIWTFIYHVFLHRWEDFSYN